MKKINIITFQNAHNYGAMLQTYALQQKLSEKNDVTIINYENSTIGDSYKVIHILKENAKSFIKSVIKSMLYFLKRKKRFYNFRKFVKENLNLTKETFYSEIELKEKYPSADIYITGSDQVWNSKITKGLQDSYTLNFGDEHTKRISYAASIGNSKISEEEKNIYKEKISKLDYISVREETAKKVLEEILEKPIEVVLDPTLLLKKEDWENKIANFKREKQKYILAYVVEPDQEYVKIVNELSQKTGLKVIHFSFRNMKLKNILRNASIEGPLEFINLIKNAEYIICTSFHATIFSIIFNKKFFVVPHRETGSRVTDLLRKMEISNRAIDSLDAFCKLNYNEEIDYEKINIIIESERNKSLKWLNNAINS